MPSHRNCAVYQCKSPFLRMKIWKRIHLNGIEGRTCLQTFALFFSPKSDHDSTKWKPLLNGDQFKVTKYSIIYSDHFVDGMPTTESSYPLLKI